jgi:SSS family solute:Na+ symporter
VSHPLDSAIVIGYFVAVFFAGALLARRFARRATSEFLTGGRTFTWRQTGLTLVAFAVDPTYMGMAGVAFLWGMYLSQWIAVHIWFTSWVAAMFLVPIYWRTRIVTTPEYLERRFNPQCRALFSLLMAAILVIILTSAVYLGALLVSRMLGWRLYVSVGAIVVVCTFYVVVGGLRTVLTLDVYQGAILLVTLFVVAWRVLAEVGGLRGLATLTVPGNAGVPVGSLVPPLNDELRFKTMFAAPAILVWATVAGLSWIACNFGTVQRLLASRSERDAQKSLLFLAVLANIACFLTFAVGAGMRKLSPNSVADEAFMEVMLTMFPVGVRGLLVAGIMAALLSTADGLLTASSTLLTRDIYARFIQRGAPEREIKLVTRVLEAAVMLVALALLPVVARAQSAVTFVQDFFGDLLGVVVALYVVGIFSRRATARAALVAMITALLLVVGLHIWSDWNFAYRGFLSFLCAVVMTLVLRRFEPPPERAQLTNLTVHTVEDAPGPWVGLKAWPGLWKWALGISLGWFAFTALWEWYGRTR